jgi:hypothetical protein
LNEFAFDFRKSEVPEIPADGPGRWFFGPGHIVIGGFYASNQFENIYQAQLESLGALEPPAQVSHIAGNYGVYAIWEQKLYEDARDSPNGLFLFGRGLLLPDDRNFDTLSAEVGAVYKGVFAGKKMPRIRLASGSPTITSATKYAMRTRLRSVRASRKFRISNLSLSWKRPTSLRSLAIGSSNPICSGSLVREQQAGIATLW